MMSKDGSKKGVLPITIYMEDTDLSGFVYHANYLKYFDRAREELLGLSHLIRMAKHGLFFTVSQLSLSYFKPCFCGDRIQIVTELSYSHSPRLKFTHRVFSQDPLDRALRSEAVVEVVVINDMGKPIRPPRSLLEILGEP